MKRMLACLLVLTLLLSCSIVSVAFQGARGDEKTNTNKSNASKTKGKTVPKTSVPNPTAPRLTAHDYLTQGQRLYKAEKYTEGVPLLLKAYSFGEIVSLPVKHHKRGGLKELGRESLCDAQLILEKGNLKLSSGCDAGFEASFDEVLVTPQPEKDGRVNLKVGKRDFNVHVAQTSMRGSPVTRPTCDNCQAATEALGRLLAEAKRQGVAPAAKP